MPGLGVPEKVSERRDEDSGRVPRDVLGLSLLDTETFTTTATYDALGRPVTQTTHDGSITRYAYNEAGLLESVAVDITRNTGGDVVQDLRYVYDPVGNVVEIQDDATQTEYFANAVVEPHQQFTYDALYRLVSATGREHVSQGQPTSSELTPGSQPETSDPAAMRRYTETYAYDAVGNLLEVQHVATGGSWTRGYHYATDGNRLLASSLPGDSVGVPASYSATYAHGAHGNMTAMPHLAALNWDALDRMQHANLGGGGDVYFQYDAAGNRVRKIRVNTAGTQTEERIYLGTLELYRERTSGALQLERETLHVADDTVRVCMVETLTITGGSPVTSPANDARYQYGNHLGTVSLELDEAANTISYEEHHPYGTSAYRAVDSSITVSAKRYRYTGMERDEETGLDPMGLRYYAPWLGRWTAADPIGLGDGVNRYAYARGRPTVLRDPEGTRAAAPGDPDELESPGEEDPDYGTGFTEDDQAELDATPGEPDAARATPITEHPDYDPDKDPRNGTPTTRLAKGFAEGVGLGIGVALGLGLLPAKVAVVVGGATLGYFVGSGQAEETVDAVGRVVDGDGSLDDFEVLGAVAGGVVGGGLVGRTAPTRAGARRAPVQPRTNPKMRNTAAEGGAALPKGGVRAPASRHRASTVTQRTLAKESNTVVDPSVNVAADVEGINAGGASLGRNAQGELTATINGRTYAVEPNGTLSPRTGEGFTTLGRGGFRALGILNKFGPTPRAWEIMNASGISVAEQAQGFAAWARFQ